ncbi:T9SS type A sorting domain-containing protein [Pseudoflavitalea sp. G-6-1-2]|uniref:FG-GAP-like repeat-containing protein n=1 Tax=Pseudoflavitalea sp. G-6-1-2 TaxID=2728841 RepID=UPI00146F65D3|nr:FG-GAP-like repeat-containing protein [Pseudoflavitalea sp. G-6-1-2]NML22937.1 T9SS type A sorting domain-containing protein [Pseudoflavitalea sp. G-6-1-2]
MALLCAAVASVWHYFPGPAAAPVSSGASSFQRNNATTDSTVSTTVIEAVTNDIRRREYHIRSDEKKQLYQASNRANRFRTQFSGNKYRLGSRDKTNDWHLQLTTESVTAGNKSIVTADQQPKVTADKEQLDFAFAGYTVQYINNDEGVRQNFIIHEAPDNTGSVAIRLKTEGMQAGQLNDSVLIFSQDQHQFTYSGLRAWDANGQALTSSLKLINNTIELTTDTRNAVFPVTIDPIIAAGNPTNANTLLESNQNNASLGYSVSGAGDLNGDGYGDVVIGVRNYDDVETDEGAAFVYYGSANGINAASLAILQVNKTGASFGHSVAFAGDVNADGFGDIIVGAPNYWTTSAAVNPGAAFIYLGSATGISTTPARTLTGPYSGCTFGTSVSGAGDVNGDGFSDVIVGAPNYNNGHVNEGAIMVYHGSSTGIPAAATTTIELNRTNSLFGSSVANAGDVNGDGYSDIIVGAPTASYGETGEGAFYIYRGSSTGIGTASFFRGESDQNNAQMGASVAGAGDINGDGYSDFIVGVPQYDYYQVNDGRVYIYFGGTGTPAMISNIELNSNGANLGASVATAGDVNGDGFSDVLISAPNHTNGQTREGVSWVYHGGAGNSFDETPDAIIESNLANSRLGNAVKGIGDVNGDGYSDIMVGSSAYTKGQTGEGIALIYHGSASSIANNYSTIATGSDNDAEYGVSVASAGDINGDGYNDVVVGAPGYDFGAGQTDEGAVFVYLGSAAGMVNSSAYVLEANKANTGLGISVASGGDINGDGFSDIIAGASRYDNSGLTDRGAIYVWYGATGGLSSTTAVIIQGVQAGAQLGHSVSSAGDVNGDGYSDVIAGAPAASYGEAAEGSVFIYHGSATGLTATPTTHLQPNQAAAEFGYAVSGAGDLNGDGYSDIVIGAPSYDGPTYTNGAAFVYYGAAAGINGSTTARLYSDRNNSHLGSAVAGAGDVNGDGFSDLILGAEQYNNGNTYEGRIQIHHGAASGITTTPSFSYESNSIDAMLGCSVAGAGDLNGDGYADIVAGAWQYENNDYEDGAIYIFSGSPSGISATSLRLIADDNEARFGWGVGSAGDVNGDGISDLVAGSPRYGGGDYGAIQVYFGNSIDGERNNIRLYNTGTTTPIQRSNIIQSDFSAGLFAASFEGNTKGKMVWETRAKGLAFSSGTNITNSVHSTGIQAAYTTLGINGTELRQVIAKTGFRTKLRARIAYDPVSSITGQRFSPWVYPQDAIGARDMGSAPLPVSWLSFTATVTPAKKVWLQWKTAGELNSDHYVVERSASRSVWESIGTVKAAGSASSVTSYEFTDQHPLNGVSYYRLKQIDKDGTPNQSVIRSVNIDEDHTALSCYPNPATTELKVNAGKDEINQLQLFSQNGLNITSQVSIRIINAQQASINISRLTPGIYLLKAGTQSITIVKR